MFQYHPDVIASFPTIRAGIIEAEFQAEQAVVAERLRTPAISDLPSIAAWRRVFSGFGVKPTQNRVAAEALLRRLDKQGDIPSINTLIDIGNLVSIRFAMPVAVFDRAALAGAVTVRFAAGDERFTDLGSTETEHPDRGEVVFVDRDGVVVHAGGVGARVPRVRRGLGARMPRVRRGRGRQMRYSSSRVITQKPMKTSDRPSRMSTGCSHGTNRAPA